MTKKKEKKNHHLFKNEHGWWYFQNKVRGGRRYKFSLGTRLISEAREARDAYLDEIQRHGYIRKPEPECKTFGMVAKEWEKWKTTKIGSSLRQYTFDDLYLYELKRKILPKFANKPINEIDFVG